MNILDFFRNPKSAAEKQVNAIVFNRYISDEIAIPVTSIKNHKNILPRFADGKPILLLEKVQDITTKPKSRSRSKTIRLPHKITKQFGSAIKYLDALNNGYQSETSLIVAPDRYREFLPLELPPEHKDLTPQWLFSGIDWKPQAEEMKIQGTNDITQKISIGLAIGIIAFTLIILLLIIAIVVG